MAHRCLLPLSRFLFAAPTLLAGLLVVVATPLRAEDEPEVPNAKFNFIGEINGNGVSIRSGPSENYYATGKLDKGARVKVVGIKFNWLKIEPPENSFSYVGKAFVDRHGDGKQGKVNNTANVRAGSLLNPMKTTIQTKLIPGTDVRIVGDEDEYYKIEPPAGAYLYVSQQFVRPVGPAEGFAGGQPGVNNLATAPAPAPGTGTGATANTGDSEAANPSTPAPSDVQATTRRATDAIAGAATGPGTAGTTQPSAPAPADAKFEQLETEFAEASQKPVLDQPLTDLLSRYEAATQEDGLPESLKRVADARLAAIKVRQEAREQLAATRMRHEEMRQRNQALLAERQELAERIKETHVEFFTAVGTLRPSSLQQGPRGTMLFRLTDPDTGRTLAYLRTADRALMAPLLNQFVGVRGELRKDPLLRLNVIQPTETVTVDRNKLGNGIAASVMPPSLLSKIQAPTVSTESQNVPVEGQ